VIAPIPAPGFTLTNGRRSPRPEWGEKVWCQIRKDGWIDWLAPWPVERVKWKHDGGPGDVVAIRRV
jgi:hypothetical protein